MENFFQKDIEHCIEVLQNGGVILYPTDTVWGLGCDATNADAVKKIYSIKKRSDTKSMIVLATSENDISNYVEEVEQRLLQYLKTTEKPTTVIHKNAKGLAENLVAADGSIAIRIGREVFCNELLNAFGKPIVSTSANLSGQPTPSFFKEIDSQIIHSVDYVVSYRQDDETPHQPSSIIKWIDGEIVVLRK